MRPFAVAVLAFTACGGHPFGIDRDAFIREWIELGCEWQRECYHENADCELEQREIANSTMSIDACPHWDPQQAAACIGALDAATCDEYDFYDCNILCSH